MVDNDGEHGSTYEEKLRWMEGLKLLGEGVVSDVDQCLIT